MADWLKIAALEYQFRNAGQADIERNLGGNLHMSKSWNHRTDIIIKNKNRVSRAKCKVQDFMRYEH